MSLFDYDVNKKMQETVVNQADETGGEINVKDFEGENINPHNLYGKEPGDTVFTTDWSGAWDETDRKTTNGDPTMKYEGLDEREAGSLFERFFQSMKNKLQILGEKDGKAIHTTKRQYDAGKIISEDDENVVVQVPRRNPLINYFGSTFQESDYNKYGYGQMLNTWSLPNEITIPKEIHGGAGKDTTWTDANKIKHYFTKPVNPNFPVKK